MARTGARKVNQTFIAAERDAMRSRLVEAALNGMLLDDDGKPLTSSLRDLLPAIYGAPLEYERLDRDALAARGGDSSMAIVA